MAGMNEPSPAPLDLEGAGRDAASNGGHHAGAVHNGQAADSVRGLEAARAINQRLFETSHDLIVIVDRWGNIIRVSPSAEAILGYRPSELVGESAIKLLHPEDLENTRNEMRLARRGRTSGISIAATFTRTARS
jgi:PAS domain-containing protein